MFIRQMCASHSSLARGESPEDAYIRYTVSAGAGLLGLAEQDYERPTVIVYVKPLVRREEWYDIRKTVQILQTVRPLPETKRTVKIVLIYERMVCEARAAKLYVGGRCGRHTAQRTGGIDGSDRQQCVLGYETGKLYTPHWNPELCRG